MDSRFGSQLYLTALPLVFYIATPTSDLAGPRDLLSDLHRTILARPNSLNRVHTMANSPNKAHSGSNDSSSRYVRTAPCYHPSDRSNSSSSGTRTRSLSIAQSASRGAAFVPDNVFLRIPPPPADEARRKIFYQARMQHIIRPIETSLGRGGEST